MGQLAEKVYMDLVGRGRSVRTARRWCNWTQRFEASCGIKRKYNREDVMKYLVACRERGLCQNSINTVVRPIKLLAEIQGWDFPKLSMPRVRCSDINRPILGREEVCELIRRGKGVLMERELAYLALSTTYGLRREELTNVKMLGNGEVNGSVIIETVKGGPVTTHIVPEAIKGYLKDYKGTDIYYLSKVFSRMIRKCGIGLGQGGYGWHSIRRSLVTELVKADVSLLNILRFMRWSEGSVSNEFSMVAIYAHRDQESIDRCIFEAHPFLGYWSGD